MTLRSPQVFFGPAGLALGECSVLGRGALRRVHPRSGPGRRTAAGGAEGPACELAAGSAWH